MPRKGNLYAGYERYDTVRRKAATAASKRTRELEQRFADTRAANLFGLLQGLIKAYGMEEASKRIKALIDEAPKPEPDPEVE